MIYSTERLQLVPLTINDAPFMYELLNTDGWIQYIGDRNIASLEDAQLYVEKLLVNIQQSTSEIWICRLQSDLKPIGIITYMQRSYLDHNDLGFAFLPANNHKGYAYEAARFVLNNLLKGTIYAATLPTNFNSIKLIEKLGFEYLKNIQPNSSILSLYSYFVY